MVPADTRGRKVIKAFIDWYLGALDSGGYALVALLGWSRVALADHTVAQVVAGSVLGAGAAALAYAAVVLLTATAGAGVSR